MSSRALRLVGAAMLGVLTAGSSFAQTAPTPQPRRFSVTVGSGEQQIVIYVDAAMMPRTATGANLAGAGPMGPLESVTIGTGEGAMTIYRDASGRMVKTQTALMSALSSLGPRRAVTVGSSENEMVIYIEEVQMTPSRR